MESIVIKEVIVLLQVFKEERAMRQSTQDLVDVVTALQSDIGTATTAIDALVAAQGAGDDEAIEAQVAILKGVGPSLKSHLPSIASAATTVAQAPEDPGATVAAAPAADASAPAAGTSAS